MNTRIYEEASDWIVKHRDGRLEPHEKKAFDHWLRESPQHVRAYLEMSSLWEDLPSLDPAWNPDANELIARARADNNVVALDDTLPAEPRNAHTADRWRARHFWYALAASILVTIASVTWYSLQRGLHATGIGEQRSLMLADGSRIELNARSRIRIRYTGEQRRVELMEGQAFFDVASDKNRPFIVQTGGSSIRTVGTAFDVYKKSSAVVVTVVEGRVAVQPRRDTADAIGDLVLAAGEQLTVTETTITPPRPADISVATAWTRRSLVFESAPLTEVAQEFNRYNTRPLVIQDPQLADFHVSGVFSSVDPGLLLRFLRAQPELVVEETDKEIRIRRK